MKKLLCAAIALLCLPAAANAATIFSNDYSSGLTAQESANGWFGAYNGGVGTPGYYYDYASGSYTLQVDLTGYENIQLSFDRYQSTENGYDYAYASIYNGVLSQQLFYDSGYAAGPMSFDISAFAGSVLTFNMGFYADYSITSYGITLDNMLITGDSLVDEVPEPAALGMLGLGLLALGARRRKRG